MKIDKSTVPALNKNQVEAAIEKALAGFVKNAPKRHTCPKCEKSRRTDTAFGFRVMNRPAVEAKGKKPVVRMQSFCKDCRSTWNKK